MKDVLMEYSQRYIWVDSGAVIELVGMMVLLISIVMLVRSDRNIWYYLMLIGSVTVVIGFLVMGMAFTYDGAIDNWSTEEGEYVIDYGKVEYEIKNSKLKVRGEGQENDKVYDVNVIEEGCEESVYAITSEDVVWVCEKE